MKCYWHSNRDAIGICKSCGRAICKTCRGDEGHILICNQCYTTEILLNDQSGMISGSNYEADAIAELSMAVVPLRMVQYKIGGEATCLICHEPLEHGETIYCKNCQELIKYGL
jgi:hypothetical protein